MCVCASKSNRDKALLVSYIIVFIAFLYFSRPLRHGFFSTYVDASRSETFSKMYRWTRVALRRSSKRMYSKSSKSATESVILPIKIVTYTGIQNLSNL